MVTKEEILRFAVCGVNAELECNKSDAEYIKALRGLHSEIMNMYNSMSEEELKAEFK